jgi:hypothetical protein
MNTEKRTQEILDDAKISAKADLRELKKYLREEDFSAEEKVLFLGMYLKTFKEEIIEYSNFLERVPTN